MTWRAAIRPAEGGCHLDLQVVPGSKESRFPAGYDPWRARLDAKVRAPPEEGRANAELCGLVAAALGVPEARVRVASGATSRRKGVLVEGLDPSDAVQRLAPFLDAAPR